MLPAEVNENLPIVRHDVQLDERLSPLTPGTLNVTSYGFIGYEQRFNLTIGFLDFMMREGNNGTIDYTDLLAFRFPDLKLATRTRIPLYPG